MADTFPADGDRAVATLTALVDRYASGVNDLAGLLDDERDALANADIDRIADLAKRKQARVMDLEVLERARVATLESVRVEADADAMERFLAPKAGANLTAKWRDIFAAAKRCRDINLANGAVGRMRSEQLKAAMAILGGRGENDTYSASGRGAPARNQRPIGRA